MGWLFTLTQISDYLQRLNLYRQRVWSCKVTGKTGLTYEEAIVSEQRATEKFLQFPKEFMTPALKIIQYSKSYSCLSWTEKIYFDVMPFLFVLLM